MSPHTSSIRAASFRRLAALLLLPVVAQSFAQYDSGFEPPEFTGSSAGVPLTGQDGFYVPSLDDTDGKCFEYAGNTLGIANNPLGGSQFVASTRISGAFARVQRNATFSSECWMLEADVNISYVGTLPTANYAGSLSLQPWGESGSIILLFNWDDIRTAASYSLRVLGYDAEGDVPFLAGLPVPDAAFRRLQANHWYRISVQLDFAQRHAVTGLTIRDLHALADPSVYLPADLEGYYLGGGAVIGDLPNAFRFFGGGGFSGDHVAGNTFAIDNLAMTPLSDITCFADINLDEEVNLQDLANLLSNFQEPPPLGYFDGDLDCDQDVDPRDLGLLLERYGVACAIRHKGGGKTLNIAD